MALLLILWVQYIIFHRNIRFGHRSSRHPLSTAAASINKNTIRTYRNSCDCVNTQCTNKFLVIRVRSIQTNITSFVDLCLPILFDSFFFVFFQFCVAVVSSGRFIVHHTWWICFCFKDLRISHTYFVYL